MHAFVTGAGGFIASHLVERLLQRGVSVRALVHYNSRSTWGHLEHFKSDKQDNLEVRQGDVNDSQLIQELMIGCDVVFHLAALIGIPYSYRAPASYVATNIGGTLNVLEACRRAIVERVIVTSTSEVYGGAQYVPINEAHPLQARSPYAASKVGADKLTESYFCTYALPVVILRPFNTYGPRQSARAIIPTILSQAILGAKEIKLGNLEPRRDLTFVSDTVEAFIQAASTPNIEGQTIHFGQGSAISMRELAQRCLDTVGSSAHIISCAERQRPDMSEVALLECDSTKAQHTLYWSPRVSLNEGLRRTAGYIESHIDEFRLPGYII